MKRPRQFSCCITAILCAAATVYSQTPGTLKWTFTTGGDVFSSPAIGIDGAIYVGSNDDKLYALKPDGTQKWAFTTVGDIISSPAIANDGTIYVGSGSFNAASTAFYAINPDGTQKWVFTTGAYITSSPAIGSDGTIYVGSADNKLYAINPDGTQKWAFTAGDDVVWSSPAIAAGGTIYVGSIDRKVYAINPDGTQKWAFTTVDLVRTSPAIGSDGTIYLGAGSAFSTFDQFYAINPDGTQKWAIATGGNIFSSAAIGADGTIYVGARTARRLLALNPNGTQKWAFTTGGNIDSSPAIGLDGAIYVGSTDDKLYAINPDGTLRWTFTAGNDIDSSPAIGFDGTIYVGSDDDKLYAIYSNSNGLAASPWPKFHGGNRSRGRVDDPPPAKDIGVAAVEAPPLVTAGNSIQLRVTVGNFGAEAQSNFSVSYQIDSETPVTENFAGTLQPRATATVTFATLWRPAIPGNYTITARTGLAGDQIPANDAFVKTVLVTQAQIFCSAEAPKSITDAGTITSTLTINNDVIIGDVNVRLHITHPSDADLDVFLTAPNGAKIELFTDVGSTGDNFGSTCSPLPNCIIDDQAATSIASGTAPFAGSFRSESRMLGALASENAKGTWTLTITDDLSGSSGTLNCWCLEITPAKPNDVGVTAMDLPRVLTLGNSLAVNVTVKNFGTAAQSNFPVRYSFNNGPAVTENFSGTLAAASASAAKIFAPFTPSAEGAYRFTAWTALSGDENAANDTLPAPKVVLVRRTNLPPVLAAISHQTVRAGRTERVSLSVMDAEADTVTFSIPTNPGFLSISDVTRTGNVTTATLTIFPARNLKGVFNASVQVKTIDGEASSAFNIEVAPGTLNPPRTLTASNAGNTTTLNWDAPALVQISPYLGTWTGSTSQNLSFYMRVADDSFIDSLNARIRLSFPTFTCTGDFLAGLTEVTANRFDARVSNPSTNITTTYHGTFASETSVNGTYDGYSGSFFIICGSTVSFGTASPLSSGTWQATKTGPGSAVLAVLQSFNIYRSSQSNARTTGTLIGSVNASVRAFTASNPATGAIYFQITAKYDQGESDPTNEVGFRTRVDERVADLPLIYALEQNYPNPFNPETTIRFQLPQAAPVALKIFNILGAEVRTLIDESYRAGYHRILWDGKDNHGNPAASGVYLYQLRAENFSQVRKMSLLR